MILKKPLLLLFISVLLFLNTLLQAQKVDFTKVGVYNFSNAQLAVPIIVDGTWIRNNIFLCGYYWEEEYGVSYKKPWIGVFDQASGKLVYEKAWKSTGAFTKIIADEKSGTAIVATGGFGETFIARFDTSLGDKGSYYSSGWTDNSYFQPIGKNGGYLSIRHEGDSNSDLTSFSKIYRFKLLYLDKNLKSVFESVYIDSLRIVTAMTDDYGTVIGVSRKNDGNYEDLFYSHQMEIFTIGKENNIQRKTIPWKFPTRTTGGITSKLNVFFVHQIVQPSDKGTGIIANVAFHNTEGPYYEGEKSYTAYFYMSIDGTIQESSIIKLVDPEKYKTASNSAFLFSDKIILITYPQDESGKELSVFDLSSKKIVFNTKMETRFPELKSCLVSNMGDIDDYGISAIFKDYDQYGSDAVAYYMMNLQ